MEMNWQPIETAPKIRNMLLTDGKVVSEGGWISDLDQGAEYEGQIGMAGWWNTGGFENPTHWMPLPEPPK